MNVRSLDVACGEAARSLVPCATDINFSSVAEPTNEVAMRPRFPSAAAAAMAAWGFALFVAAAHRHTLHRVCRFYVLVKKHFHSLVKR